MAASLKKTVVGAAAALTLALTLSGAAAPASAQPAFHGGAVGGWHGGGWNGGWHGGYGWRGGYGWGPLAALGAAGLATGAIIASEAPYYDDCTGYGPVYDAYGNYLGQRPVNICR